MSMATFLVIFDFTQTMCSHRSVVLLTRSIHTSPVGLHNAVGYFTPKLKRMGAGLRIRKVQVRILPGWLFEKV